MKKDIEIPKSEGLFLVTSREFNEELGEDVWNIYLLNGGETPMETIMVVLRGYKEDKKTSVMRKKMDRLDPGSFARLEFLREELLDFRNEYLVTYFAGNTMYEKNFMLEPGQVSEDHVRHIEDVGLEGIVFS